MNTALTNKVLMSKSANGIESNVSVSDMEPIYEFGTTPYSTDLVYYLGTHAVSFDGKIIKKLTKCANIEGNMALQPDLINDLEYCPTSSGWQGYFGPLATNLIVGNTNGAQGFGITEGFKLIKGFIYSNIESDDLIEFPEFIAGNVNLSGTKYSFPKFLYGSFNCNYLLPATYLYLPILESLNATLQTAIIWSSDIQMPNLSYINGTLDFQSNSGTEASFPKLKYVNGNIALQSCSVQSIQLPSLSKVLYSIYSYSNCTVQSLNLGSDLKMVSGSVTLQSNTFNQSTVDHILTVLAALDGSNGTTAYSNKPVTITGGASAPSATGLAAKAILVARGCTVNHN